jgi:hypothetical protein
MGSSGQKKEENRLRDFPYPVIITHLAKYETNLLFIYLAEFIFLYSAKYLDFRRTKKECRFLFS